MTPPKPTLRTVDSSQPRLARSRTQRSATASPEYLTSGTASSDGSRITVIPYRTPPSRLSPAQAPAQNDAPSSDSRLPPQPVAPVPATIPINMEQRNGRSDLRSDSRLVDSGTPTPGVDDTPFIRYAIDQLTRDERATRHGRHDSTASAEYQPVVRLPTSHEAVFYTPVETPGVPVTTKEAPSRRDSTGSYALVPTDPPNDTHNYPPLNYVPLSLRPLTMVPLIVLCLALVAGLVFCNIWSQRHGGLWDYDRFGGRRYLVFQFLPQILAVLVIFWTFIIQAAVYRLTPLAMIAGDAPKEKVLQKLPMIPRNFLLPDLSHYRYGEFLIGACLSVVWLANIAAIPLQSCLFQVRFHGSVQDGGFRWTSVQGVAWMLVALYSLLAIALAAIMARFIGRTTGLLWDPVSIADVIPLIQRSNVLEHFDRSEVSLHVDRYIHLPLVRLGYWRDSTKPGIIYSIGSAGHHPAANRASSTDFPDHPTNSGVPAEVDLEQQCLNAKGSFERTLHSPFSRYRWAPWFLRDTFVVAWIVIVAVLTIAFVVVSFVRRSILNGFLPLLPTLPSDDGFSSSNFLYSFIPSLIGTIFFLAWQPIDVYFRAAQSYASLSSSEGASAESSLLLAYNACLPVEVTFLALTAKHYKVAFISFLSVANAAIPVLAGGIFLARFYSREDEIRISTYLPAYYTLMGLVVLYAISMFLIWPRRKRYLPHPLWTYADVISFLYQSPLLTDSVFREPKTKADLVTRTVVGRPGEGEVAKYAFGIYRGRDGREHLGVDRLSHPDRLEMLLPGVRTASV